MAIYSTVTPININDPSFELNGTSFLTHSLPHDHSTKNEYFVFNGQLYIHSEDGVKHDLAQTCDFTGSVTIFKKDSGSSYQASSDLDTRTATTDNFGFYTHYVLEFERGLMKSVSAYDSIET